MNRRLPTHCLVIRCSRTGLVRAALACGLTAIVVGPLARAQTAVRPPLVPAAPATPAAPVIPPPKAIPQDEKISNSPNGPALQKFVKDNVARLTSDDADAASSARGDLVAASLSSKPDQPASAPYVGAYLSALSKELRAALEKKPSVRVKVNIGIVTAKVAENVKAILPPGMQLQTVILMLLKDENDAVALWGMKAASAALSAPNQTAPSTDLLNQVLPSVKDHKLNGPITDEAYGALQDSNPVVIHKLIDLYDLRVAAYKDGVPQDPAVDRRALSLTVQSGAWAKMSATEQAKVMNRIADLLSAASKALGDDDNNNAQIHLLLVHTCEAIAVVTSQTLPDLSAQALRASKMGTNTPPPTVIQIIDPLVDGVRKAFPQAAAVGASKP